MQKGRRVGQHRSTKQFGGGVAFYVIRIKGLDEQAFFERTEFELGTNTINVSRVEQVQIRRIQALSKKWIGGTPTISSSLKELVRDETDIVFDVTGSLSLEIVTNRAIIKEIRHSARQKFF
jgi:hypothetical protein